MRHDLASNIADFGCSSGPNTLFLISHIMDTIKDLCKHNNHLNNLMPQLEVFLNDLPNNDFNNLFKLLSEFNQKNGKERKIELFVYGVCGSFYGRLFPSNSLHFAYSSFSVHWLSQVEVLQTLPPKTHFSTLTILSETLSDMVAQGLVKQDDLYSFNVPIYTPCLQEVKAIISDDRSFNLDKMDVVRLPYDAQYDVYDDVVFDKYKSGKLVASKVRAFMEPMLASHFGSSINVDGVFDIYAKKMAEHLSKERLSYFIPVISLTRKFTEETRN
ncbi:hypothetical protein DH2020_025688 [Rehmannia glutinosa]|uniref:Uncharacterized protein n=1 Tax=Rehmannia glutinosa TaxID=99300 RepID=A0ABR0VZ72_REHGL